MHRAVHAAYPVERISIEYGFFYFRYPARQRILQAGCPIWPVIKKIGYPAIQDTLAVFFFK